MESAIHIFSKTSYEGASLRDIAAQAGVPLSTIHMYFGSKYELYTAVERKAWDEVDNERSTYLNALLAKYGDRPAPLAELIYGLALPIVRRALGQSEHDRERIFLIRSRVSHRMPGHPVNLLDVADRAMVHWIDAMAAACPTLARTDVVWAFSFVVGAIYSWQLVDHRYDRLLGPDIERTVAGITGDIVAFGCAGVQAMIDRRLDAAAEQAPQD